MAEAAEQNVFHLSSGYTVKVKTLGPHALDSTQSRFRDPGEFTYTVKTAAEGDVEFIYDPPEEIPDREADLEVWQLYKMYEMHQYKRSKIAEGFQGARTDFVLTNCLDVLDGPLSVEDSGWLERIEHQVEMPEKFSERWLLFLKTQVMAVPMNEWNTVTGLAIAPEVTMEGILNALRSFQPDVGSGEPGRRVDETAGRADGA